MNVGSLFAGIGGFDLGLRRAGMRVSWQVEQDPYCRAVLARHFPEAERFEDVRTVGAAELCGVDLICGGFPCQDLSAAGRGAGLGGARSGLWGEFARIVRDLRPAYVVVENVPALLTGKGRRWERAPIGRVLGDLAEAGYDAEWARLSAREFGAPHLRRRVWIVAYPARDGKARPAPESRAERQRAGKGGAGGRARSPLADAEGEPERPGLRPGPEEGQRRGRPAHRGGPGGDVADADRDRRREGLLRPPGARERPGSPDALGEGEQQAHPRRPLHDPDGRGHRPPQAPLLPGRDGPLDAGWWSAEPGVGRVADGVPARVERLAALGNALVPEIAEWIGRRILAYEQAALAAEEEGEG